MFPVAWVTIAPNRASPLSIMGKLINTSWNRRTREDDLVTKRNKLRPGRPWKNHKNMIKWKKSDTINHSLYQQLKPAQNYPPRNEVSGNFQEVGLGWGLGRIRTFCFLTLCHIDTFGLSQFYHPKHLWSVLLFVHQLKNVWSMTHLSKTKTHILKRKVCVSMSTYFCT